MDSRDLENQITGGVSGQAIAIAILVVVVILLLAAGIVGWTLYGTAKPEVIPINIPTCARVCNPSTSYLESNACKCVCFPGYVMNADGVCVSKTCASGFTWDGITEMCISTGNTGGTGGTGTGGGTDPTPSCPKNQVPILKDDGTTVCGNTTKACDGYYINGQCIKKDCSNVKCQNGGSLDSECVCKCAKGFSGRDCSITGCVNADGSKVGRCYNGSYDKTTCRCNCDNGFSGYECNVYSGVSSKKDCDKKDKAVWTGFECITTQEESPFPRAGLPQKTPSDFVCYGNIADDFYYIHEKSNTDQWQCYLGDNVHGIIGDDTSYLYGQRCIGGSKEECLDLIAKLV